MNTKDLIGGMIAGAAIGVFAGLALAPEGGKKAKKKLAKGSLKSKNKVKEYVKNSVSGLRDQFNERIDQLARKGKDTISHVSEKAKA